MGNVTKMFFHFKDKFWPEKDGDLHDFVWDDKFTGNYTEWRDVSDRIPGFNTLLCMASGDSAVYIES